MKISDDALKELNGKLEREIKPLTRKVHSGLPDVATVETEIRIARSESIRLAIITKIPSYPWKFVIYGAKPHRICARLWKQCGRPSPWWKHKAKALRFTIGGQTIIRKAVNHPGIKGRQSELKEFLKEFRGKVKEVVHEWLTSILKKSER